MYALRLAVAVMSVSANALAQGATVVQQEGRGEAAVGKDKAEGKAIEEARTLALRNAVEQAAGVRLTADTLAINNQLVRDEVLAHTSGFIKSSEIISKKVEKGVASVVVKAEIVTENLDKDIAAAKGLVKSMGRPSVVISIQEQTGIYKESTVSTTDNLSKFLAEALAADGWSVLDPAAIDKDFKLGAAIASGDAQVVRNIGALTKANFVVYGSASFRHQDPGPMMAAIGGQGDDKKGGAQQFFPVSGEYGFNVFSSDNGAQIARVAGSLKYDQAFVGKMVMSYEKSTFELLKKNRDQFVSELRKGLLEYLRNKKMNGTEVAMSVSGLPSMGAVNEFSQAIAAIKGVKASEFLNDFKKGTASFRVTFAGDTKDLAEAVEAATFKKKKLEVVGMTSNTMDVALSK
jgi:hypothetical protein